MPHTISIIPGARWSHAMFPAAPTIRRKEALRATSVTFKPRHSPRSTDKTKWSRYL